MVDDLLKRTGEVRVKFDVSWSEAERIIDYQKIDVETVQHIAESLKHKDEMDSIPDDVAGVSGHRSGQHGYV